MYSWIWRHLPGPAVAKAVQAVVLVVPVAALLWYVVFPWLLPRIPVG